MRHDGLLLGGEMWGDINVIIRRKTDPHQGVTKQHRTDESGGVTEHRPPVRDDRDDNLQAHG